MINCPKRQYLYATTTTNATFAATTTTKATASVPSFTMAKDIEMNIRGSVLGLAVVVVVWGFDSFDHRSYAFASLDYSVPL